MIENEQERAQVEPKEIPDHSVAIVEEVFDDGVTLQFPSDNEAKGKHYKCNSTIKLKAGDKVYVQKVDKTYIVLFPVGGPAKTIHADTADSAATAVTATSAGKADTASKADSATTAENATKATNAETATAAGRVNCAGTSGAVEFRTTSNGDLQFRMYGYVNWYTLAKA